MSKTIKIFKSFEEQAMYKNDLMINTTPLERFRKLFLIQQMTKKFHPVIDKSRKIIIHRSCREKDAWDIARLEELRNLKK